MNRSDKSQNDSRHAEKDARVRQSLLMATAESLEEHRKMTSKEAHEQYHHLKRAASKETSGGSLWDDLT